MTHNSPLKLAYFSPLPPQRTGIADYSADLLPYLRQLAQVTAFVEDEQCLTANLPHLQSIRLMRDYAARHGQFDLIIYQMGNSSFHESIYTHLQQFPGVTVLHDYGLHHLIGSMTAWRGNFAGYARELGYALGSTGIETARAIQLHQRDYPIFQYPLNERVLDCSLGVIVHSQYAAQQIQLQRPNLPVAVIPQLIAPLVSSADIRQRLQLSPNTFIAGCVGQATSEKLIDVALRAFAQARARLPDARFLLVGEIPDWYPIDLDALLRELDLTEAVMRVGRVDDPLDFDAYIKALDVCVSLRFPTLGETSRSVLQSMAAGRVVIVSNVGWYAELPDDACLKIDHDQNEVTLLAQHLIDLAADRSQREALGRRALAYIQAECAPAHAAQAYVDFAQRIIDRIVHFA